MTDENKPAEAGPTPPPSPAPEQNPAPEKKPDRIQLLRDKAAQKPRKSGPVPSLEKEQTYGFGKKVDDFDADMERELQEAMAGMSDKDLYAEDARKRQTPDEPGGKKKGKVFRVHGQDVFIDLPGGRSQG